MRDLQSMSIAELLKAIEFCDDTGTNVSTHGQADDYTVGSLKMAEIYRKELKRREVQRRKEK